MGPILHGSANRAIQSSLLTSLPLRPWEDASILGQALFRRGPAFTPGPPLSEFDFLAFLPTGEFDIVRHRRPRQQGGRDNSMSSHSIHTQSNNALHDAPRASATVGLFDQAMVTAVVIAIAYIASIMVGWL